MEYESISTIIFIVVYIIMSILSMIVCDKIFKENDFLPIIIIDVLSSLIITAFIMYLIRDSIVA